MPVILWDTLVIEDLTVFWNKLIFVKNPSKKSKKYFFIWKYKFVRSGSDLWETKEDGLVFITGYFRKKEFLDVSSRLILQITKILGKYAKVIA